VVGNRCPYCDQILIECRVDDHQCIILLGKRSGDFLGTLANRIQCDVPNG
jgi:hypothetical protein